MYITLEQAKKHLILDEDFHDDDEYITDLIAVAEKAVEVKEAVVETVAEVKSAAAKKTSEAKEAVKKTAKKVTKKAADVTITVEFAGRQAVITDIAAKAEAAYKAINADAEIKTLDIYVKPEENAAYYVVNGEGSADFRIEL